MSTIASVGFDLSLTVTVLFQVRDIGLGAAFVGLAFATRGVSAVPGALAADRAARRFGLGRASAGGWVVQGIGLLMLPLAAGPLPLALAAIAVSGLVAGLGETVANVGQWSLRQAIVPDELQARVTGAHRAIVYGAGTLGATAGGILGNTIGFARLSSRAPRCSSARALPAPARASSASVASIRHVELQKVRLLLHCPFTARS